MYNDTKVQTSEGAIIKIVQTVMLYDGQCILCRQSVSIVKKLDWFNNIEMLDAQDQDSVKERYPELDYDDLMGAIHVVTSDRHILVGFFAMRYVVRYLPLLWLIWPLLYLPGMNRLGPRIYGWIARRRYAINRMFGQPICDDTVCRIP